jgi:polyphosphate kinase
MTDILTTAPASQGISREDSSLFINREISMLAFHQRVLEQAKDPSVPLLERMKFLTISCAILDEFFEVRVGWLKEQIAFGLTRVGEDGLGPGETLERVRAIALELVAEQYRLLNDVLLPALELEGIFVHRREKWPEKMRKWAREYFDHEVLPVLTPVGLDPAHPFPRVLNKSLNFIVTLEGKDAFGRKSKTAVLQAPRPLPRLIAVPREFADARAEFVLLSSVIHAHVEELFPGMKIASCDQFRLTRNSDLWIDEEEVEDLLMALKGELPRRHYGKAVRLEVSDTMQPETIAFLLDQFELEAGDLYKVGGPVNLHRLEALYDLVDRPELKYRPFVPDLPRKLQHREDIFAVLREHDILLHHPYQSFSPVIDFIQQAARDPDVLAIKQTLYRTGMESPMSNALLEAATAGKEVTAVVELRARFDEAANIELASRLQEAGAKVAYGVVGVKTHAKMLLVVRRESDGLRRYVHLGTGNYNARTARQYTDWSYMTSKPDIGEDVHALFLQLTGLGRVAKLEKLVQTPFGLYERILELIEAEAKAARAGKKARIIAKMNSLIEPGLIRALYSASEAGVSIDLIVRGICSLRPGVKGVSENIRVRSILGRFLEHHRMIYFYAGGDEIVLASSADWMPRNLFRRVEIAFPIEGKKMAQRAIEEGLQAYLDDNTQAWVMESDGRYRRQTPGEKPPRSAQTMLLETMAKSSGGLAYSS